MVLNSQTVCQPELSVFFRRIICYSWCGLTLHKNCLVGPSCRISNLEWPNCSIVYAFLLFANKVRFAKNDNLHSMQNWVLCIWSKFIQLCHIYFYLFIRIKSDQRVKIYSWKLANIRFSTFCLHFNCVFTRWFQISHQLHTCTQICIISCKQFYYKQDSINTKTNK